MSDLRITGSSFVSRKTFYVIYILAFLTAFHYAIPVYIESSFMEDTLQRLNIDEIGELVGIIYSIAAFFTFILFVFISKILRRTGNFLLAFFMITLEIVSLIGLALSDTLSPLTVIPIFILHLIAVNIIMFNLDLFLESVSDNESTGSIRGTYLTALNTALIIAPFIAGLILTDGEFWKVFIAAAFMMLPALVLIYIRFRDHKDPEYKDVPFIGTIKEIWANKDIFHIMMSGLMLRFFFSWMIIYTPIYLHQNMGISYSEILGVIMPIALLPFILFEFVLGKAADTTWGEQELLTAGFIILAFGTATLAFVTSSNPIIWGTLMFLARTGAAFVEIMTETYFYKKIDADDAHLIGYFKNLRPLAYLIAPAIGTLVLVFSNYQYLFLVLAVFMGYGTIHSLSIRDTK